ncbi:MAG: Rha family transcriptional regulator [Selenomonadaceae bacterium]|nr:Rha family transcriptional regulator [Selenomonadaceae bacterium]
MNELVFLQNEQALTTSLKVAEVFDKQHIHVMRDIRELSKQIEDVSRFGQMFCEDSYPDSYGRRQPMYTMNYDGFALLTMGFTGKKALKFKLDYIQAFNAMQRKIVELMAERKSEEWRAIRQAGKQSNKKLCAAIHEVIIPLARDAGSVTPDERFYQSYQRMLNKTLGIKPRSRDELPLALQYEVDKCHNIAEISIRGRAAQGKQYKQIFQDTKQTLESYSQLSFISERFPMLSHELQ